jgi:hypothetical protein
MVDHLAVVLVEQTVGHWAPILAASMVEMTEKRWVAEKALLMDPLMAHSRAPLWAVQMGS